MAGAFVDFILQVAHGRHPRSVIEKSVAALAPMGHPADVYTALFAEIVDAPHKLVASHLVLVSDKNVLRATAAWYISPEGNWAT